MCVQSYNYLPSFITLSMTFLTCVVCITIYMRIKDGIQPNLADWDGTTPLRMAAEERHGKIVEMLLRKDEVRAIGWDGWRPMRRKRGQPQLANGHAKKQRIH